MATKPIVSFTFAVDANFSSGPASGFPTKVVPPLPAQGHVAGSPIVSEYVNYHTNILGDWTVWLLAGSDAPGLDAHLVETNSNGWASLAQLTLGGTAAPLQALIVTQNTGAQSSSIFVTNTGTGFAMTASAVGTVAAVRGSNTGTGPGIEGLGLGTNNIGVKGTGQGTASGGLFTGGATGPGATCTGGATGGVGALCTGTGASPGVSAVGGATAAEAVLGTAAVADQLGVQGVAHASGSTAGAGLMGVGRGNAPGIRSEAESGYGVIAQSDQTAPTRAAFRKVPQNADPTTVLMGDEMHRQDIDIGRVYTDGMWQSPWTTASGHAHGLATPRTTNATNDDDTTYVDLVTTAVVSPYEPRFAGGSLLLLASARFGDADSSAHHYFVDVQVIDVTGAAIVYEESICLGPANVDAAVNGYAISQWTASIPYVVPLAGARTFRLRFKPTLSNGFNMVANAASLNIIGVFG